MLWWGTIVRVKCSHFSKGGGERGLFWQADIGMPQWGPLSGSILQSFPVPPLRVPSCNPPHACETSSLPPRSLLIGQRARWHPPWHPVWADCPTGARKDKTSVVVSERGVKNALDPSLGSQAPSVAPALWVAIWLQRCLTLKIDGEGSSWGPSKRSLAVFCHGCCACLSFTFFCRTLNRILLVLHLRMLY